MTLFDTTQRGRNLQTDGSDNSCSDGKANKTQFTVFCSCILDGVR